MNNCKFCAKEFALNELSTEGLCVTCHPEVMNKIQHHVQIIQDSFKLAESTENERTYYGLLSLILKHLKELELNFVTKGINATNFDIQKAIEEVEQERKSITYIQ